MYSSECLGKVAIKECLKNIFDKDVFCILNLFKVFFNGKNLNFFDGSKFR